MRPISSPEYDKYKMLVVDDEPDNLDLLYRTFRKEFEVLRAAGGMAALQLLAEAGDVAVIISDQRMPEMKGTEFIRKTLPDYPDTVKIILTGFTDVDDLVEAINTGQVYRYLTKPWEPDKLKQVVRQAVITYETAKQRTQALGQAQMQNRLLQAMAVVVEQRLDRQAALGAVAQAILETFETQGCGVQIVRAGEPVGEMAIAGDLALLGQSQRQLMAKAITTGQLQGPEAAQSSPSLHQVMLPIVHQERTRAVVVLQWLPPLLVAEPEQWTMAARQLALAIASLNVDLE